MREGEGPSTGCSSTSSIDVKEERELCRAPLHRVQDVFGSSTRLEMSWLGFDGECGS